MFESNWERWWIGCFGIAGVILIALRIVGVIQWPIVWVLCPFWVWIVPVLVRLVAETFEDW